MTYTIYTETEMPDFFEALKNFVSAWKGVKVENDEEVPNALTAKVLREADNKKNLSPVYTNMNDFLEALNA